METQHSVEELATLSGQSPQVALLLHHLDKGGAERMTANLALGFAARGVSVDLVLMQAKGSYLSEIPVNVRVVNLGTTSALRSILALAKYLRRARPTVMRSCIDHINVTALLAKRIACVDTRLVVTQCTVSSRSINNISGWRAYVLPYFVRKCYPCANAVIAVSSGIADMITSMVGVPPERVHVVYNPVITQEFLLKARQPFSHPWFSIGSPPVILAIGSLYSVKDHATLIRAVVHANKKRSLRLLILGEGPERPSTENLIQDLHAQEFVSLPGFVQNPYPYLRQAAAMVISSKWESFSNVLVEALALNVPVISTDCDFGPREILQGGRYGKLVPVGDVSAMAEAILTVLEGNHVQESREFLRQYTSEVSVERYLRLMLPEASDP